MGIDMKNINVNILKSINIGKDVLLWWCVVESIIEIRVLEMNWGIKMKIKWETEIIKRMYWYKRII